MSDEHPGIAVREQFLAAILERLRGRRGLEEFARQVEQVAGVIREAERGNASGLLRWWRPSISRPSDSAAHQARGLAYALEQLATECGDLDIQTEARRLAGDPLLLYPLAGSA